MAGPISCVRMDPTRSGAKIPQAGFLNGNPLMLDGGTHDTPPADA